MSFRTFGATPKISADLFLYSDTTDALASLTSRNQRTNLVRAVTALGVVFLVYTFILSPFTSSTNVAHAIKQRKARLAGVGESHVLPKRWREGHSAVGGSRETLPECKRMLLFKFSG